MISATAEDVCTVISIMPIQLSEDKPLNPSHYAIPACRDVEHGAETLVVKRGSFRVYIDESRPALIIPEPADIIAGAICRDFKIASPSYIPGQAEPGLFWVRGGYDSFEALGDRNLNEEFVKARQMQENWFKALVSTADDDWSKHTMRRMISDLQRLACKSLGLDRAWDMDLEVTKTVRMANCKFCRADVHPEALICLHCRGILDMARYKKEYISAETVKA